MSNIIFEISGGTPNYTVELRDLTDTSLIDTLIVGSDGTYMFTGVTNGLYYLTGLDDIGCSIISGEITVDF